MPSDALVHSYGWRNVLRMPAVATVSVVDINGSNPDVEPSCVTDPTMAPFEIDITGAGGISNTTGCALRVRINPDMPDSGGEIDLTATAGDIGSLLYPIIISTDSATVVTAITISATSGNTYLACATDGCANTLLPLITVTGTNALFFTQTTGDIVLPTLSFDVPLTITATAADGSIMGGSSTITAPGVHLRAPNGSIGTESMPVAIACASDCMWSSSNLSFVTGAGTGNVISITTADAGIVNASISGFERGSLFFEQSMDILTISQPLYYPEASITLRATDQSPMTVDDVTFIGSIASGGDSNIITARSLTLRATGSIGSYAVGAGAVNSRVVVDVGYLRTSHDDPNGSVGVTITASSGAYQSDLNLLSGGPIVFRSLSAPITASVANDARVAASAIQLSGSFETAGTFTLSGYRLFLHSTVAPIIAPALNFSTSASIDEQSYIHLRVDGMDFGELPSVMVGNITTAQLLVEAVSGRAQLGTVSYYRLPDYDSSTSSTQTASFGSTFVANCNALVVIGICTPMANVGSAGSPLTLFADGTTDIAADRRITISSVFVVRNSIHLASYAFSNFNAILASQDPNHPANAAGSTVNVTTQDAIHLGSLLDDVTFDPNESGNTALHFTYLVETPSDGASHPTWGYVAYLDQSITADTITIVANFSEEVSNTNNTTTQGDNRGAQISVLGSARVNAASALNISASGSIGGYVEWPGGVNPGNYYLVNSDAVRLDVATPSLTLSARHGFIRAVANTAASAITATAGTLLNFYQNNVPVMPTGTIEVFNAGGTVVVSQYPRYSIITPPPVKRPNQFKGDIGKLFFDLFDIFGVDCNRSNLIAKSLQPLCYSPL